MHHIVALLGGIVSGCLITLGYPLGGYVGRKYTEWEQGKSVDISVLIPGITTIATLAITELAKRYTAQQKQQEDLEELRLKELRDSLKEQIACVKFIDAAPSHLGEYLTINEQRRLRGLPPILFVCVRLTDGFFTTIALPATGPTQRLVCRACGDVPPTGAVYCVECGAAL